MPIFMRNLRMIPIFFITFAPKFKYIFNVSIEEGEKILFSYRLTRVIHIADSGHLYG